MWCLLKKYADKFREGLVNGEITPSKLNEMSSEARTKFLEEYVGEQAVEVNKRFERSLLLKNQDRAMLNWAKNTAGITDAKRQRLLDSIEARKQERFERTFNPSEEQTFLSSLAEQKVGSAITRAEAKTVFDLTRQFEESKSKYDFENNKWKNENDRLEFSASQLALVDYTASLKDSNRNLGIKDMIEKSYQEKRIQIQKDPIYGTTQAIGSVLKQIMQVMQSNLSTLDDSFIGRQGIKTLYTHPKKWFDSARLSVELIAKSIGGQEALDIVRADVFSRPNAMNGKYEKAKLLDLNEEAFPSSLPEKIPHIGKVFKASEAAFKGTALRLRADVFDLLLEQSKNNGVNIEDKYFLESTGTLVNTMTSKGVFTKGVPDVVQILLWAPKMIKSQVDFLTAHSFQDIHPVARKEAWKNLFKATASVSLLMAIANAFQEGSAETNPLSSDFGKIRFGSTRIDITGGSASYITLAARLLTNSYKSSQTGEIKKYGQNYGDLTALDALYNFFQNKSTPGTGVIIDILRGKTFEGEKPTFFGELEQRFIPIALQNVMDYIEHPDPEKGIGVLADFVGLSSSTYATSNQKTKIIPEDKKISNEDFIHTAWLYAQAVGTDPETAFNRIFTGQRIRRIDNGAIIVERLPLSESQAIKEERGGNTTEMKLDHTIPLQLGGGNEESNLKLVTTAEWKSYTPVENKLGDLLRNGIITKKEAQQYILDFKEGRMTKDEIFAIQ